MSLIRPVMIVLLTASIGAGASALPRFASRTGAKCQSCHVNPSGGAMRQAFGVQYGREQLPVPAWSKEFELEDFSNVITNVLGIGADFRTLFFSQNIPDATARNGFFQMQGDIYLNFRIAKKVSLFFKKGLRDGFEAFGLFTILPASGHVKVGKFVPNYGIKTDDHTAYVRQATEFTPERGRVERTGIEAAISPGPFTIMAGVYNADESSFAPTSNSKAILGRGEGMFKLADDLFLGLGGNVFTKKVAGITSTYYGGFGSFSWNSLTVLGEADWVKNKTPAGSEITGFATSIEADYPVIAGLDLKLGYDFFDPDTQFKTGATSRYSVGFEFFPLSGVEVRPVYRIVKESPANGNKDEIHVLLHLYL